MTGRGKLSDFEKGKIVAYKDCGLSNLKIAIKLGRSHTTIANFLKKFKATGLYSRRKVLGEKEKQLNGIFFFILRVILIFCLC